MKVKELIEKLKQFNGETTVARLGHDGGYEDIDSVEKMTLFSSFTKEHDTLEAIVID